jgi:hypothetical protein
MSTRSVQYTSSPLLASKTPVWRSQFIVACIAVGFLGLVGRAAYVQVIDNAFFKKQGALRFIRVLELPANRGRILDRNGLILASSVSAAGSAAAAARRARCRAWWSTKRLLARTSAWSGEAEKPRVGARRFAGTGPAATPRTCRLK